MENRRGMIHHVLKKYRGNPMKFYLRKKEYGLSSSDESKVGKLLNSGDDNLIHLVCIGKKSIDEAYDQLLPIKQKDKIPKRLQIKVEGLLLAQLQLIQEDRKRPCPQFNETVLKGFIKLCTGLYEGHFISKLFLFRTHVFIRSSTFHSFEEYLPKQMQGVLKIPRISEEDLVSWEKSPKSHYRKAMLLSELGDFG